MKSEFYYQFIAPCNWFNNCRSILTDMSWNIIRESVLTNITKCTWCGIPAKELKQSKETKMYDKYLHIHEKFIFENDQQILVDFIPLCYKCHNSTHIRGTIYNNKGEIPEYIIKHIKKITGKSCVRDINNHLKNSRKDFKQYQINLAYLNEYAAKNNLMLESKYTTVKKYLITDISNIKLKERNDMKCFFNYGGRK